MADGSPSYTSEMYTVVVSNPNGAKCYEIWKIEDNEAYGTYPYGTILSVSKSEIEGFWDLDFQSNGWSCISSDDVEIYGEPATPQDLRFEKLWYE